MEITCDYLLLECRYGDMTANSRRCRFADSEVPTVVFIGVAIPCCIGYGSPANVK